MQHTHWMTRCLELARQGAGTVSPNPMVGCVLVGPEGNVLGEGWHKVYGGSHAEVHAIADAERRHPADVLQQATLYVNLEPCSHFGKTPPCADLIVEKKIPRVVIGMTDPNPKVAGAGITRLKEQDIDVTVGVLGQKCKRLNEAFVHHIKTGRPLVILKTAQTLDGRIATATDDSKWVSGQVARTLTHQWRSELDGVWVGAGTALADDPALTVRHVEGRQPIRVVLDRAGTLPTTLQLFTDGFADHTIVVTHPTATPAYTERLIQKGGRHWRISEQEGHLDLYALLKRLGQEGKKDLPLQSVLVEAGSGLATALFTHDLVDRFYCFIAPKLIGEGRPTLANLNITRMAEALTFVAHTWEVVGEDFLFRGCRRTV